MTQQLKVLADLHSATCFFNALLREWRDYVVYQAGSKTYVLIYLTGDDILEIPIANFSLLGRHHYTGKFLHNKKEVNFATALELVCAKLAETVAVSNERWQTFKEDVLASRENIYQALNLAVKTDASDFKAAEQGLLIGHNFHPTPKSRDKFSIAELHNYAPECNGEFQLQWLLVDPAIARHMCADSFDADWLHELFKLEYPQYGNKMLPVPMHPWQWQFLQQNSVITEYLKNKQIIAVESSRVNWAATSSLRTVYRDKSPYMLKFSMNLKLTNSVRVLLSSEVARGLLLHDVLASKKGKQFLREFPDFRVMTEPASICLVDESHAPIESTMLVCRDNPFNGDDAASKFMLATLTQDEPFGGTNILLALIQRANTDLSFYQRLKLWFTDYLHIVVKPLLLAYMKYGIIMEGHQQNIVIALENGFPVRAYFRDCQDHAYSELGYSIFSADVAAVSANRNCIAKKDIGCYYFIYQVILNSTFNVITTLAKTKDISELELIEDLRVFLHQLNSEELHDPYCLNQLLENEALLHKCNFQFALRRCNDNQLTFNPLDLYAPVPNLLRARRPKQAIGYYPEVLYQRCFTTINKTVTLRALNLVADLERFILWQRKPRIARYWQLDKSHEEVETYLRQLLAQPGQRPVIIEINHEPAGYVELYWVAKDIIADYYDYHEHDRGFHLLIGEDHLLGVANTRAVFMAIMDYLYLECAHTNRIIVEPDARNINFIKYTNIIPGWQFIKEVNLPDKRAALFICERDILCWKVRDDF